MLEQQLAVQPNQFFRSLNNSWEWLKTKNRQRNLVTSEFPAWAATSYAEQIAIDPKLRDVDALNLRLSEDWYSYSSEYAKGELISTFDFPIHPKVGLLGTAGTYEEGIDAIADGFSRKLASEGQKITRSEIETTNWKKLNTWSLTAPPDSLITWSSPPYNNVDGHSFVFVYHKVSTTLARMYQYRCWPHLEQHQEIQKNIAQDTLKYNHQLPISHQIIEHLVHLVPPTTTNRLLQKIWARRELNRIQTCIYASTDTWRVKPEEMPLVDDDAFNEYRTFLFSLYATTAIPLLLKEIPTVVSLESKDWQKFSTSKRYKTAIKKLDAAFAILAAQPLQKWVEVTDQRPRKKSFFSALKIKLSHIFGVEQNTIEKQSSFQVGATLQQLYSIKVDQIEGRTLSKEDVSFFNTFAPNLLSVGSRAFSLGQCGVGAFIPTQLLAKTSLFNAQSLTAISPMGFEKMSVEQKTELKRLYRNHYKKTTIFGQTWYILNEYAHEYTEKNCSIDARGVLVGPCGLPLVLDSYCLNQAHYDQITTTVLENNDSLFTVGQELMSHAQTDHEKEQVQKVITFLQSCIKTSVGLTELLFNDFWDETKTSALTKKIRSLNPLFIIKNPDFVIDELKQLLLLNPELETN